MRSELDHLTLVIEIHRAEDPRVALYQQLRDADLRRSTEAVHGVFVAEGLRTVTTLLESAWPVVSLMLTTGKRVGARDLIAKAERRGAPVYVAPPEVFDSIAGFPVHRGVLALGQRLPLRPPEEVIEATETVVVAEGVNDHENLGSIFRNAAVLGAGAVLLDPACCDPLYRRCVRVSLGNVLRVPYTRLEPWPSHLSVLQDNGFTLVALDPASPAALDAVSAEQKIAIMVGREGDGLSDPALSFAAHRVRIPMAPGFDSLNVATALAIALDRLVRR